MPSDRLCELGRICSPLVFCTRPGGEWAPATVAERRANKFYPAAKALVMALGVGWAAMGWAS